MKKIFIGVGIFVVLIVVAMIYLNNRNRTLSPAGLATYEGDGLSMEIPYSRPTQRGRLLFGKAEEGALQPYGAYWRLGANEPTTVMFSRDVIFNSMPVPAGTYVIYAFPGEEQFEIRLNSVVQMWGAMEPDPETDFLITSVPHEKTQSPVEQYTIRFEEENPVVFIVCEWGDMRIRIPVE
jgi:hypothetical protein